MYEKVEIPKIFIIVVVCVVAVLVGWSVFTGVRYRGLREQAKEYRRTIAEGRRTIGDLEGSLVRAEEYIDGLEKEAELSREYLKAARREIEALKGELGEAKEYISRLEETNKILTESGGLVEEHIGSAREGIQQLIEDVQAAANNNGGS